MYIKIPQEQRGPAQQKVVSTLENELCLRLYPVNFAFSVFLT